MYKWTGCSHVLHSVSLEGCNLSAVDKDDSAVQEVLQGNDTSKHFTSI